MSAPIFYLCDIYPITNVPQWQVAGEADSTPEGEALIPELPEAEAYAIGPADDEGMRDSADEPVRVWAFNAA